MQMTGAGAAVSMGIIVYMAPTISVRICEVTVLHWLRVLFAGTACLLIGAAQAADVAGLYETIVPPSTDKNRESAFVEALRAVAVKASGARDAGAKISGTIPNLRTYVQRFEAVRGDGSVLIGFDPFATDRLLTTIGL